MTSTILNSRLIGRSYLDAIGQKVTVAESIPGLAPGYVTVQYESGRKANESLYQVLCSLEPLEHDLSLAASLLAHAEKIKEHAVAMATLAASHELPPEADLGMISFDDRLADASAYGVEVRKETAAVFGHGRPPAGPKR